MKARHSSTLTEHLTVFGLHVSCQTELIFTLWSINLFIHQSAGVQSESRLLSKARRLLVPGGGALVLDR
jgi:hypothetical protein